MARSSSRLAGWTVAVLWVFARPMAAAERAQPLFRIGQPDGSPLEFGLVDDRWPAYAATYRRPIVYTIGRSRPAEWPYIHPSTRDVWAGGQPHIFTIRFTATAPVPAGLHLIIGALSIWEPSLITVRVNGQEVATRRLPSTAPLVELAFTPEGEGRPTPLVFALPDGAIRTGDNELAIELKDGSWLIYDYVELGTNREPPPLVVPPGPDLVSEFRAGPLKGVPAIVFAVRQVLGEHWYANIGYYSTNERAPLYRQGGRLCKLDPHTGQVTVLLDDAKGGVRDPCVDYDGRRILFSYRRAGTAFYHLYTVNADGSDLRQLTSGDWDDYEPCWLPDGGIAFVTTRAKRWVNCWLTQVGTIWRCAADGSAMRPLSANLEHDNTPWVLPDGRLLYMRWEYVDRSQVHYHHLWTMNPDGTNQAVYYGNLLPGGVFIDARPIPGSDQVVLINSPGHGQTEHAGYLATLRARLGPDAPRALRHVSRGSSFRDPWAFGEEAFMCAQERSLVLMNGKGQTSPLFKLPAEYGDAWLHEPRPLVARPREPVAAARTDLSQRTGRFYLADVNHGRNLPGVRPGEIKRLMIAESLPKPINFTGGMDPLSYKGTFTLERALGTVPVEPDGSAYFEAPALRSLFFVALDADGRAVKRMQSFTTVQPGETLACLGCHEERTASRLSGQTAPRAANRRVASAIEPFAGVPALPDFPRDVQPVFDRHCARCHSAEQRTAGVDLSGDRGPMFSHSYYTLTVFKQLADGRNYARSNYPPRTLGSGGSPLVDKLAGRHHDVNADAHDQLLVRLWLDLGAPYPGTYAALGTGTIGGYIQNEQVLNNDRAWPETRAAQPVYAGRCVKCHQPAQHPVARTLSDEIGLSFWDPDMNDRRLKYSRHLVYNLTRPELSLILRAPLARAAGGLGLCRAPGATDSAVFTGRDDPGYRLLLAQCEAGRRQLDEVKRFDMPGFRPRSEYVREMKRFGILPASFDLARDTLDVYETDRRYWESLWYRP